jgi:hypothetical protein
MNKLVVGPWVGEFGWELMSWQGRARKLAERYTEVVVCSRVGHELLYADFADDFISHSIDGVKDCSSIRGFDVEAYRRLDARLNKLGGVRFKPGGIFRQNEQTFVKYGHGAHVTKYDILVHARRHIGKRSHHAYPLEEWDKLVLKLIGEGLTVAAIGTEAFLPHGAVDLRSMPLFYVANVVAASKLVIGPSSGPMHFASLCGTKHIVWTDKGYYSALGGTNRARYERLWNPFKTPCRVIDDYGWDPPVDSLFAVILEELRDERH